MPMTNDIERLHGRIAELEARVIALEVMNRFPKTPDALKASEDGWITWNGGECPVDARQLVECRFRGFDPEKQRAGIFDWSYFGTRGDIIAYRVVK